MLKAKLLKISISLILIFSGISSLHTRCESALLQTLKKTLKEYGTQGPLAIAKDFGAAYSIFMGTVILHEHTHAFLVHLLYGVPCDTFVGCSTEPLSHPKEYTNTLHMVSPVPGDAHYFYSQDKVKKTPLKELIIALSGPILAFVFFRQLLIKSTQSHEYLMAK